MISKGYHVQFLDPVDDVVKSIFDVCMCRCCQTQRQLLKSRAQVLELVVDGGYIGKHVA